MSGNKQYGLLPKKSQPLSQKHAAFGDDSESDTSDKGGGDWVKKALKREAERSVQKRQTRVDIQRALEQDSTVFQYDEVYDQIEQKKQESSQAKVQEKKPKYIQQLLHTAERRKIENERRIERQVQKEREAEGEEFKDKETFVTSAYKKKLEEFAKMDEEQKRQDMLEEIGDVTKQQDISGFYRHLYQTTLGDGKTDKNEAKDPLPKEEKTTPSRLKGSKEEKKESRHYRKRKNSVSSEDKNKDADTDGSSSSSSSSSSSGSDSESDEKSSESETEVPKRKRNKESKSQVLPEAVTVQTEPAPVVEETRAVTTMTEPKQPERSIWEKRTVGSHFDDALKRYYERKAVRLTAVH
jgi:coiled-coil domain-containing protein 55